MKTIRKKNFRQRAARMAAFLTAAFSAPAFAQDAPQGMATPWEMGFQAAASTTKARMMHFHNDILLPVITAIVIFVLALLVWVVVRYNAKSNPVPSKTAHNTLIEVIWTVIPTIILILIVVPSMKMLYYVDRTAEAEMTLKITGYQWYWGYEYPDDGGINFMANLVQDKDLKPGQPRLLATDNAVVLPVDTNIRLIMTASDVIHSWAVPAFGVKMDAVPGRLNETWVRIDKVGTFYGQCSELCGQGHGFMPIEVHAVSKEDFAAWVKSQGGKMPDAPLADKNAADVTKVPGVATGGMSVKNTNKKIKKLENK